MPSGGLVRSSLSSRMRRRITTGVTVYQEAQLVSHLCSYIAGRHTMVWEAGGVGECLSSSCWSEVNQCGARFISDLAATGRGSRRDSAVTSARHGSVVLRLGAHCSPPLNVSSETRRTNRFPVVELRMLSSVRARRQARKGVVGCHTHRPHLPKTRCDAIG